MRVGNQTICRVTRRLGTVVVAVLALVAGTSLADAPTADATTLTQATVASPAGNAVSGVASYPDPASVIGVVTGSGTVLGDVLVTVFSAGTGKALREAKTDGSGRFSVGGLPAGLVKVRAVKSGWLTSYATGKSTLASADVYTVQAGDTLSVPGNGAWAMHAQVGYPGLVLGQTNPLSGAGAPVLGAVGSGL
jgi:hypothetical protein